MNKEEIIKKVLDMVSPFEKTRGGDNLYVEDNFKLGLKVALELAEKEFNLSEKIRELDLQIMNNEISLLVFLNKRNELDTEFIRRLKEKLMDVCENKADGLLIHQEIDKLAGEKLMEQEK